MNRTANRSTALKALDRGLSIACALFCTAGIAQAASAATCPPGYNGTYPHCVPRQRKPPGQASLHPRYMETVTPSPSRVVPIRKSGAYPIDGKILDPHKLPPQTGPGPAS